MVGVGVRVGVAVLVLAVLALAYPFLFVLGARRALKAAAPAPLALWVWLLYPWLYLVTFAVPNPLIFRWYLTPPLPAYFGWKVSTASFGVTEIEERASRTCFS